jgi:hypothetical protein
VQLIEHSAHWDTINDRWILGGLNYASNNIHRSDPRAMGRPIQVHFSFPF